MTAITPVDGTPTPTIHTTVDTLTLETLVDNGPLMHPVFQWAFIGLALAFAWMAGLTGIWALALLGAGIIAMPHVIEGVFTWWENRYDDEIDIDTDEQVAA
jgi:hypothetical protein